MSGRAVNVPMREVPIVDASASDPSVELPVGKWLEPACPTCGDRLFPMPQPDAERLSHICRNGHKWRNDPVVSSPVASGDSAPAETVHVGPTDPERTS